MIRSEVDSLLPADVQQLLVVKKEEVPPEWNPSMEQQVPESVHIKGEEEELCISQEGEQLNVLEEADITRFLFTAVTVKSESDEEDPQFSQLRQSQTEDREAEPSAISSAAQIKTESDGEDCERSKPAGNLVLPADVQQLLVGEEEVPPGWSSSLEQEEPKSVHIKEEQGRLCTGQEGEQLNVLEEADFTRLVFNAVTVKSEHDEEEPQSSQLHQSQTEDREVDLPASSSATQIKTETNGHDCEESKPAGSLSMSYHPQSNTNGKVSESCKTEVSHGDWQEPLSDSGPETKDSDSGWEETQAAESGVKSVKNVETTVTDVGCNARKKSFSCFQCGKDFYHKGHYKTHMRVHTGEKPFPCDVCGKRFNEKADVKRHLRVHTGEKPFTCNVCGKSFTQHGTIKTHMRVHTGEKPFSCDVCGKRYNDKADLKRHMRVHTGENPFACDVCGKRFKEKANFKRHMRVHTGEKPFACDVCSKRFTEQGTMKKHMKVHTGEKPFGCDVCSKRFGHRYNLKKHMSIHTREKPLSVAHYVLSE